MSAKKDIIYKTIRPAIRAVLKVIFKYKCEIAPDIDGSFIAICNHVTKWDPVLMSCSFINPLTFIAGEHTSRMGFLSKIIGSCFSTIQRVKGGTDATAALGMLKALKHGASVALFPEGTRSFDGVTGQLHPTTGRLLKMAKATVVTYRISGAYLTSPRWGNGLRKGRASGKVVNVYTPDMLAQMTPAQITEAVNRDIYENAYEEQVKSPVRYKGKNKADGLEHLLFVCPECKKIGTVTSKGDTVSCTCGMSLTYNDYGFFEGDKVRFSNPHDWNVWQNRCVCENKDELCFEDTDFVLYKLCEDHTLLPCEKGTLSMSKNGLCIADRHFPLDKIKPALVEKQNIVFSFDGINYQLSSDKLKNALKYIVLYNALTGETE